MFDLGLSKIERIDRDQIRRWWFRDGSYLLVFAATTGTDEWRIMGRYN